MTNMGEIAYILDEVEYRFASVERPAMSEQLFIFDPSGMDSSFAQGEGWPPTQMSDGSTCSGIYAIKCKTNGKLYIGQARNIPIRKSAHFSSLRGGYHQNEHLQAAFNLLGESCFEFMVLEYAGESELDCKEISWIAKSNSDNPDHGYNLQTGGCKYPRHSKLTLEKMSRLRRGFRISEETKEKISRAHRGKKLTKEHRAAISKRLIGRRFKPEQLAKMSAWQIGKKLSEETKRKIGEKAKISQLGRKHSEETRARISAGIKNFYKENPKHRKGE